MRPQDQLQHPLIHAALSNVLPEQHHMKPDRVVVSNTTLAVPPLPGGPSSWDIAVDFDAVAVIFNLRSVRTVAEGAGKAGVIGIATRSILEASCASLGGYTSIPISAQNSWYTKPGGSLLLSHKVFDNAGEYIALTDAHLTLTGPTTRVLRLWWTNYAASYKTLDARGLVGVLGD